MSKIPDNIEAKKHVNFTGGWSGYRIGYSNLGSVRIYGASGNYTVYMSDTLETRRQEIQHLYVRNCSNLATVSEVIKHLKIDVRDGKKVILAI